MAVERAPNSERLVPQVVEFQDHGIRLSAVRAREIIEEREQEAGSFDGQLPLELPARSMYRWRFAA